MVQPRHLADKINEKKLIYDLLTGRVICEQKLGTGIKSTQKFTDIMLGTEPGNCMNQFYQI
jgi:hypothetical protein